MGLPVIPLPRLDKQEGQADFRAYLEHSLRDPFTLNLRDCTLMEIIAACKRAKSRLSPNYSKSIASLVYNLRALESEYRVTLQPIQVTDVFWSYFISFCIGRGLKASSVDTLCQQLRSILNWASKYNAHLSPTYDEFRVPKVQTVQIALTADEVSRIAYFDIDRFYADKRKDYRETMRRVRDMFVLSCNLFQRHSDMLRIDKSCFDRNIFTIIQQKTGNRAVVNIDLYAVDPRTTYRILEQYDYKAPYTGGIGNYNVHLHQLMKDIGFEETIRIEERQNGILKVQNIPKYKLISSHTARRTAITINVLRGHNVHAIKKCSGHIDLKVFDKYVKDD